MAPGNVSKDATTARQMATTPAMRRAATIVRACRGLVESPFIDAPYKDVQQKNSVSPINSVAIELATAFTENTE
jgi:hypothetical protein